MNYLLEINAFYNYTVTNQVSSSAKSLWHALMQVNNTAGWCTEFTVAASRLCAIASLSESSFRRARSELAKKGIITYRSRGGNQCAIYQLISLSATMTHKVSGSASDNVSDNPSALVKQNETIQKDNTTTKALLFYEENFLNEGEKIRPLIKEELMNWVEQLGEDLVIEAMKRAIKLNASNWHYVEKILLDWNSKGVINLQQADAERQTFKHKKNQIRKHKKNDRKQEVIPEWFHDLTPIPVQPKPLPASDNKDVGDLLKDYLDSKKRTGTKN